MVLSGAYANGAQIRGGDAQEDEMMENTNTNYIIMHANQLARNPILYFSRRYLALTQG